MDREDDLLRRQVDYYRARAPEYDAWYRREGRYDRGEDHRRSWRAELRQVESALSRAHPGGPTLELACGTGLWTRRLARRASEVTAVDASPEALALCRERVAGLPVSLIQADLFDWKPPRRYRLVFFAFWLSHVPRSRFARFWEWVAEALEPDGRVFFVDSRHTPASTAVDHVLERDGTVERALDDGRRFRIVKVFHEPEPLAAELAGLGWESSLHETDEFFLHGRLHRS